MLEELGQDYDYQLVDFARGDARSPEFLAFNPAGKVPAIQDGDLVLLESAAIVTYLGDKFSSSGLVPPVTTTERAKYEQWSYFTLCELEQPLWTISKHKFALPREQRVPEIINTAAWEFQQAARLVSMGLGDGDYILGEQFSAADILLAQTLFWGTICKLPLEQGNLEAYVQRAMARPALARALARENAALEANKT